MKTWGVIGDRTFNVFTVARQWRRSQVKSGGINTEKSEGVASGEGLCPPQLGVWGLPQKQNQFCTKNYAILSKFWYFFPILKHKNFQQCNCTLPAHHRKWGGLSPSPKSGGLIPLSPCSDAYVARSRLDNTASHSTVSASAPARRKLVGHSVENIQLPATVARQTTTTLIRRDVDFSLLPPPRDLNVTSRLRTASTYHRPTTRTKRYTSFVQHGLLHYQTE